jgi:hypothetical protein
MFYFSVRAIVMNYLYIGLLYVRTSISKIWTHFLRVDLSSWLYHHWTYEVSFFLQKKKPCCRNCHFISGSSIKWYGHIALHIALFLAPLLYIRWSSFLDPFAKLRKVTISIVLSVRPSVRVEQLGSHRKGVHEYCI